MSKDEALKARSSFSFLASRTSDERICDECFNLLRYKYITGSTSVVDPVPLSAALDGNGTSSVSGAGSGAGSGTVSGASGGGADGPTVAVAPGAKPALSVTVHRARGLKAFMGACVDSHPFALVAIGLEQHCTEPAVTSDFAAPEWRHSQLLFGAAPARDTGCVCACRVVQSFNQSINQRG